MSRILASLKPKLVMAIVCQVAGQVRGVNQARGAEGEGLPSTTAVTAAACRAIARAAAPIIKDPFFHQRNDLTYFGRRRKGFITSQVPWPNCRVGKSV